MDLFERAEAFRERNAIISDGTTYSYADLLSAAKSVATHLLAGKIDLQEARIAFMVPPSFAYVAVQWGIWRAGGIAVPLCVQHPLPSLRYVLEDTGAEKLVVHPDYEGLLSTTANELKIGLLLTTTLLPVKSKNQDKSPHIQLPKIAPDRSAMILYTSGTTSLPKGVVSTHANIIFQIKTLVEAWHWSAEDQILNVLPLHHVHGIINVLSCALWSGGCNEFMPRFEATKVWEKFASGELSLFMAVPTIYYKLIRAWEVQDDENRKRYAAGARQLRLMVSGSAALPVSTLEKWRSITEHTLLERYGMTEIGMALSNSYTGERRPGHVGQALPGVDLRLVDDQGDTITAVNQAGEIQVKGANVFRAYWNKPQATQGAFTEDGWFRTGDIAELNDGLYRILGRDSVDIIKSGGYKISALEIEEVMLRHPSIEECAVVGIPDPEWGELIAAGIVSNNSSLDPEAISNWLKEQLPKYRIPRRYLQLESLPRNTLGKVTKNELKKLFA